jgi:hypothetical protein
MKKWMSAAVLFLAGLLGTLGLSGCGDSGGSAVTPEAGTNRVRILSAESGSFSQTTAGESSGADSNGKSFTLTMANVHDGILWYSDRPERDTGVEDLSRLAAFWGSYYGNTRPNGVLSFRIPETEDTEILYVVLDKPQYDHTQKSLRWSGLILGATNSVSPSDFMFEKCVLSILNNVGEEVDSSTIMQHSEGALIGLTEIRGEYVVTLEGSTSETVFVENAPGRNVYRERTGPYFVDQWNKRFAGDLPNASLYGIAESGERDIYTMTLRDPVIDLATDSIQYSASFLAREGDVPLFLESAVLLIDSSQGVEDTPDICTSTGGRALLVTNNCGTPSTACTDKKSVHASSNTFQFEPSCLQNLCAGSSAVTVNLPEGSSYAFWVGEYGSSTLAEVTVGQGTGWDAYDISFNKGFDIGMTLVAPEGMTVPKIVAKTKEAYGAYPLPTTLPDCWAAPCTQPNYSQPPIQGGTYQLFLCNQAGEDASTPGPYGCALNECPPGGDMSKCPDWTTLPCQGTPKLTGEDGCMKSCPGT